MTIILYDLVGDNDCRFSPYCWRARMALVHKGLAFDARPVPFTRINDIVGGDHRTVPVIDDSGTIVRDSFAIAEYLEDAYPDRPSLFGGEGGRASARFVDWFANGQVLPAVATLIVKDIHDRLLPEDQEYFRDSREKRFGKPLEDVQDGRDERRQALAKALLPLKLMLRNQPFIGGDAPLYHDYIVFATLQWPRLSSPFKVLEDDDPVVDWFERCLDLHGGVGRAMPAAA